MIQRAFERLFITAASSGIGGAAGGATFAIAASVMHTSGVAAFLLTIALVLGFFGIFGAALGGLVGLMPTFVVGTSLRLLRAVPPFDRWFAWAIVGGGAGWLMQRLTGLGMQTSGTPPGDWLTAWTAAWIAGGAAAMTVYWRLDRTTTGASK